jgi:hypothetical protein
MRNPWTAKNPFMSMWLSAANSLLGAAQGHAGAAVRRQAASIQAQAARQAADFWSGKKPKNRKRG